jgi:glycosyltransferase involved in cell wall biosynthesis
MAGEAGHMKIAVIAGLAESLINFRGPLLTTLAKGGHEVIAIAPGENPEIAGKLRKVGVSYCAVELERTGMNPVRDIRALLRMTLKLRSINPDIVLGYTIKPVIFGSLAARLAGVPHIFSIITGLGYAFMKQNFKQSMVNRIVSCLYRIVLAFNEKVFFQNPDDMSLFCRQRLIGNRDKAELLNGSGVDLDYFGQVPAQTIRPVFLLIARLLKNKGIDEYAEAARILKTRYPTAEFRILGPFDSNPAAVEKHRISEWQKAGIIKYMGETSDVRPFIAEASVYVLPSYREGTPRSVLEAMAMGRPVVTTTAPGCRETVIDGENGFLVPVKDKHALARAMEKFIINPDLVATMGQRSREIAEDKYDVHKVNSVIMEAMGLTDEESL